MRLIIFIALLIGMDFYVADALSVLLQNWNSEMARLVLSFYWLIPMMAIALGAGYLMMGLRSMNPTFVAITRGILIVAYLAKFLTSGVLLIDDVRLLSMGGFENLAGAQDFSYERTKFVAGLALSIGVIPFFTLTYGMIRNRYRYKIFQETISIENLPENLQGLRIVQISDIHSGSFTAKEPIKLAIEMINAQKADLVFFTGDLVNNVANEMEHFTDIFDKIKAKYGVFSILGNHDYGDYVQWESPQAKAQNMENLKDIHRQMGWDLLLNENRLLPINGEEVAIIGVENYSENPRFSKYGDLVKAYKGAENADLKLLLSHDPTHWDGQVLQRFTDIAITFSGHTHGMQFGLELGKFFKWSPAKYLFKQWAGLYRKGTQYLYVNRGFGFLGYPGRVGILPEITVIDLENKEE
ncbi:MAG: putative MPP superfamily phosphohydrolase [Saprospiraceae bacterium]|jgi:predicted MPP superfamily phosphohydrolase